MRSRRGSRVRETWLPVVGYEGRYKVSDQGRVMSLNYKNTGWPRMLRTHRNSGEYRAVKLTDAYGVARDHKVHRLVMAAFVGPCPTGLEVNHEDGKPWNNRRTNLVYETRSYNEKHKHRMGLVNFRGVNNPRSKLTLEQIADIRSRVGRGETFTAIAKTLDVTNVTVSNAYHGRTYARS